MNFLLTKYNGAILGPIAKVLGYILEGIYAFFVEKMILLEEAYWEYRDLINERLKGNAGNN